MGRSGLFILIVIVLLAIGAYFVFYNKGNNEATTGENATTEQAPATEPATGAPGGENMAAPAPGGENMATPAPENAPMPEPAPAPENNAATPPSPQL